MTEYLQDELTKKTKVHVCDGGIRAASDEDDRTLREVSDQLLSWQFVAF